MDLNQYSVPGSQAAYYIPNFITQEEEEYLIRKITESPQPKWKRLPNRRLQIWGMSYRTNTLVFMEPLAHFYSTCTLLVYGSQGGELTSKNVLLPQAFPSYITKYPDILSRIRSTGAFKSSPHGQPNHVILNEYLPGHGIMPHEDGPSYHPVVATLSLGSHAVFHYYRYRTDAGSSTQDGTEDSGTGRLIEKIPSLSVLLEPRSLVITTGDLYTSHLHGIDDVPVDEFHASCSTENYSTRLANLALISDPSIKTTVVEGGTIQRRVRYSLTCRDVQRVVNRGIAIGR